MPDQRLSVLSPALTLTSRDDRTCSLRNDDAMLHKLTDKYFMVFSMDSTIASGSRAEPMTHHYLVVASSAERCLEMKACTQETDRADASRQCALLQRHSVVDQCVD